MLIICSSCKDLKKRYAKRKCSVCYHKLHYFKRKYKTVLRPEQKLKYAIRKKSWYAKRRGFEINDNVTEVWLMETWRRTKYCLYCAKELKIKSLDHIVSLKHGGRHERSNLRWICQGCNQLKGQLLEQDFIRKLYPEMPSFMIHGDFYVIDL